METTTTEPTLHHGGCHCGDVRYTAVVDLAAGTRCNCTICVKLGATGTILKPAAFTLVSDETTLASYSRMPDIASRYFCKRCHVSCFSRGHIAELGGDFVSVNLNTIDDYDPTLRPVQYWDGRHDNWMAGPRPTPWPVASPAA